MKADDFVSTPEDLIPAALAYGTQFNNSGWKVSIEPFDLAYPRTPPIVCKRAHTTCVIEVQSAIQLNQLREWARYCKTCARDTRIILGLTESYTSIAADAMAELKAAGVGVYMVGPSGPYEVLPAIDLAMSIELPEIPTRLRGTLGESYDHFGRGQWREGFETACTLLEQEARRYLKLHTSRGRLVFQDSRGRTVAYTQERIEKMTMGALAVAFGRIVSPNQADSRIGQALARVNEDRITVAHYKGTAARREGNLRKNVPRHMFVVMGALRELKGIKA